MAVLISKLLLWSLLLSLQALLSTFQQLYSGPALDMNHREEVNEKLGEGNVELFYEAIEEIPIPLMKLKPLER